MNDLFVNKIIDARVEDFIYNDRRIKFIDGSQGPIWYRGYFNDPNLSKNQVDGLLEYFEKSRVVVGHTSFDSIETRFNNKIIVVDSSIKLGKYGELLIIEDGEYWVGDSKSEKKRLF